MQLSFSNDYLLENDRVLLRPLCMNDQEHLMHFSINEPELWEYSLIPANGLENLHRYLKIAVQGREAKNTYPFIVWDKLKQQYAGSSRFYDIQLQHSSLQLGFTWYGKEFQGSGLNKNCKYLLLEFAFESLGVERVEFRADNKNIRSIAAMKSIGCKEEGVMRSNCNGLTGRRDSIVLSILKEEWFTSVKENLLEKIRLEDLNVKS
jgi:RimJ/RimL family protein N-acetyltransferase